MERCRSELTVLIKEIQLACACIMSLVSPPDTRQPADPG
jgi:hypothetical protein